MVMAISWLTALKAVPWSDVVQAAPGIVKGARKLFTTVRGEVSGAQSGGDPARSGSSDDGKSLSTRLAEAQSALEALRAEQTASAELIRSLAEQNAKVVEAIEILRARQRVLLIVTVLLCAGMVAIVAWAAAR